MSPYLTIIILSIVVMLVIVILAIFTMCTDRERDNRRLMAGGKVRQMNDKLKRSPSESQFFFEIPTVISFGYGNFRAFAKSKITATNGNYHRQETGAEGTPPHI